jgi:hypothetical protein
MSMKRKKGICAKKNEKNKKNKKNKKNEKK